MVGPTTTEAGSSRKIREAIIVGVPKEIKTLENRVGLTPSAASAYVKHGHHVLIQQSAGLGSGFSDLLYRQAGCEIVDTAEELFKRSAMIIKVKEPLPSEYKLIRQAQLVYTYFHFAASEELTKAMLERGATCIAYETIVKDGTIPLLTPMSEVAGRMAVQEGAKYLEKPFGGRGVLLSGVPGVLPGKVLILGGGVVGVNAARVAAGLGADVTIVDVNLNRLRYLDETLPPNVKTMYSNEANIVGALKDADLVIGAVLVVGAKAPHLVRREHLKLMKPGSVVVDVAVDQGGCIETCRPTTHDKPTFVVDDIVHYCVANMPGAVPMTSTLALNNATLPYGVALADMGLQEACHKYPELQSGLNVADGKAFHPAVAQALGLKCHSVLHFFKQ